MNPEKATYYYSIEKEGKAEFKDRGSRFIAIAFPIRTKEDFKNKLKEIKKEHPKAVHHCFGYRLGTEGIDYRSGDDGEPSGSAGRPILGQIDSRRLTNCAVVVVRYFGGTLLGIPGLIHAYKTSTALVLQTIPVVQKPVVVLVDIEFEYPRQSEVMHILRQVRAEIVRREMTLFCNIRAEIPVAVSEEAKSKLNEIGVKVAEFH